MNEDRKYRIKGSWIFNLEAMYDKLWCIQYDLDEGKLQFPIEIAGTKISNDDDMEEFRNECYNLEYIAKSRKVTSKEYGRIKEIVSWRVNARYARCMASGMDERDAGKCFEDL